MFMASMMISQDVRDEFVITHLLLLQSSSEEELPGEPFRDREPFRDITNTLAFHV